MKDGHLGAVEYESVDHLPAHTAEWGMPMPGLFSHIHMLRDECLVRIEKPERLSASKTLFIPDSAKRQDFELYQATVIACGPGRLRRDGRLNPIEVKPGDRVLVYWAGAECQPVRCYDDTQELRIIAEWSIQAVLED